MAYALGLSKKTLVDIEKKRRSLGWTSSVALCSVFQESEVLAAVFGGQPSEIILALAFDGKPTQYAKTFGSRAWWSVVYSNQNYVIEQNIISQHYRMLNVEGQRIASSFDIEDLMPLFNGSN